MQSIDGVEFVSVPIRSRPGQCFLVDKDDLDVVDDWSWCLSSDGYVKRTYDKKDLYLHRAIFEKHFGTIPEDKMIDHIDRDKLNNRKSNLRLCSHAENMRNRTVHKNNKLGVKGVRVNQGKYEANIRFNNKVIYLGYYESLDDAALAYNIASIILHFDFSCLNQYRIDPFDEIQKKRFFELKDKVKERLTNTGTIFAQISDNIILDRLSSSSEDEQDSE